MFGTCPATFWNTPGHFRIFLRELSTIVILYLRKNLGSPRRVAHFSRVFLPRIVSRIFADLFLNISGFRREYFRKLSGNEARFNRVSVPRPPWQAGGKTLTFCPVIFRQNADRPEMSGGTSRKCPGKIVDISGNLQGHAGTVPAISCKCPGNNLGNFPEMSRTFPGIFPENSRTYPGNFPQCVQEISGNVLQMSVTFLGTLRIFCSEMSVSQGHVLDISWNSQGCSWIWSRKLPGLFLNIARKLSGNVRRVSKEMSGRCRRHVQNFPGHRKDNSEKVLESPEMYRKIIVNCSGERVSELKSDKFPETLRTHPGNYILFLVFGICSEHFRTNFRRKLFRVFYGQFREISGTCPEILFLFWKMSNKIKNLPGIVRNMSWKVLDSSWTFLENYRNLSETHWILRTCPETIRTKFLKSFQIVSKAIGLFREHSRNNVECSWTFLDICRTIPGTFLGYSRQFQESIPVTFRETQRNDPEPRLNELFVFVFVNLSLWGV